MYHEYSVEELRALCRNSIETLEKWGRSLIHQKLRGKYGDNYFEAQDEQGNNIVKKELTKNAKTRMNREPARYKRLVDTMLLDDITYILCKDDLYKSLFKEALDYAYPNGKEVLREYLDRINRNPLAHANPISMRDAERIVCYCNDFIDGLKEYYKAKGEEKMWNVPTIVSVNDTMGNVYYPDGNKDPSVIQTQHSFYVEDTYGISIEVDSSFDPNKYSIRWWMNGKNTAAFNDKAQFTIKFEIGDVAQKRFIACCVISNEEWHKYGSHDHRVLISFTVLPPHA